MEHGATRNFESLRRLQEKIVRESKECEEEEAANPMKVCFACLLYSKSSQYIECSKCDLFFNCSLTWGNIF